MKIRSNLSSFPSPSCKSYADLPWQDRTTIVKLHEKRFNPTNHVIDTESPYTKEWWSSLTGDERSAAYWTSMYPDRTRRDWVDNTTSGSVGFYDEVNDTNAEAWYYSCPTHLLKQVDAELNSLPSATEASSNSELYQRVAKVWGGRPKVRVEYQGEDVESYYWLEEWTHEYERLQIIDVVLKMAPRMQKERKMLSQALGLKEGGNGFPAQTDGLDDVTAATVNWITSSGETPLEYLASVYRDPDSETRAADRIAAARALMEYVHRKLPTKQEVKTETSQVVDLSMLKGLSRDELDTLEALLKKGL